MTRPGRAAAIFAGAALGGLARHGLVVAPPDGLGFDPELGLLLANLSGSFVAGAARAWLERAGFDGGFRRTDLLDAFAVVGFAGGFTSYSAFVVAPDGVRLVLGTLVGCPLAALAGLVLGGGYPARPTEDPR
ncbi:MAG: hypothetical protein RIS86_1466 [Planctomycetota bacterium]